MLQANPLKGANSLDLYIKKIHSVFEMHTIVYGSPEDLPPFVNSLRKNRHLAMDFWALTAAIQRHEGEISNEKLLDIITQGVSGKDAADLRETGEEQKQAVDNLSRLLAGEDIDNPLNQPEEPWPPKPAQKSAPEKTPKKERPVSVFSRIETVLPAEPEPVSESPITESGVERASASETGNPPTPQEKAQKHPPINVISRIETLSPAKEQSAPENPVVEHAAEEAATLKAETSPTSQETTATQPRSEPVIPAEREAPFQNPVMESVVEGASASETEIPAASEEDAVRAAALWQSETDLKDDLPSAASPTLSKHALDEALVRLELSSRQLKRHLAQIDHRMSRLEPHLRELASKMGSQPDEEIDPVLTYPPQESEPSFDAMAHRKPQQPRDSKAKPRLVLKDERDDSSDAVPFENYYAEHSRGLGTAGWFALIVLLGGSIFAAEHWFGSRHQFGYNLHRILEHTNQQITGEAHTAWDRLKKVFSPASSSSVTNSTNSGSLPSRATTEDSASQPSTNNQPAAENNSPAESPTTSAPASTEPAPSGLTVSNARETVPVRPNRPLLDDGEYTSARASLDSEMPVNVPASVMQDNLITSRVPAYPETAKADGVEGPVVLQALISKNGTVDRLHVVQGDPLLRGAASEAVSKWQYRPYTVNGRPVEVATTVRVEFRLPRR